MKLFSPAAGTRTHAGSKFTQAQLVVGKATTRRPMGLAETHNIDRNVFPSGARYDTESRPSSSQDPVWGRYTILKVASLTVNLYRQTSSIPYKSFLRVVSVPSCMHYVRQHAQRSLKSRCLNKTKAQKPTWPRSPSTGPTKDEEDKDEQKRSCHSPIT